MSNARRGIIILSIILIIPLVNVYAHPFLMESSPENFEQLSSPPDKVVIIYSEPVEEGFSYIRVTDSNGNRVDNDDTKYFDNDEAKLVVTLKPDLADDVYTVSTKVLSKVDGHIVDYTFSFIIGEANIEIPTAQEQSQQKVEAIYAPESLARFPGIIGQYIIVGVGFGAIYIWRSSIRDGSLKDDLAKITPILARSASILYIIGVGLVIGSSFAMLALQAATLGIGLGEVIGTGFGNIVLARLIIAFISLALYPFLKKNNRYSIIAMILGFALLATLSLMGHSAAVSPLAISIDMLHNALAAIWVGTIFYLAFSVMSSLKRLEPDLRTAMISLIIPRFSKVTILALGILAVTGPTLLFFIETDLNLLFISSYGTILAVKLALIAAMLGAGAFNQFGIHRKAINLIISLNNAHRDPDHAFSRSIHKKFTNALRVEAAIGIIVLLSIAFLTNAGLPKSEYPFYSSGLEKLEAIDVSINNDLPRLFNSTIIDDAKVNLSFKPARVGINTFMVKVTDQDGKPLEDLADATIKLRQIGKDVSPLVIKLDKVDAQTYTANGTITSNGKWAIEVNIERTQTLSISTIFTALIKPDLDEMKFELVEYDMPFDTLNPVHLIYKDGSIWTSDGSKPRIWRFDIDSKEFKSYTFDGTSSIKLAADSKGRIWFTDPLGKNIGYFNPANEQFKIFKVYGDGLPTDIYIDFNDNIWLPLINIDIVAKFDPDNEEYNVYRMPLNGSQPAAVVMDNFNNIWIAEAAGRLAKLTQDGEMEEFEPAESLAEPFALLVADNTIWISEHIGPKLTRFDPLLQTFQSFRAIDDKSLPYGMIQDNFGNIWFAQHVLDKVGVLDPMTGKIKEVEISSPSWVQFLEKDDNGNIWFAEPRQAKIAMISIKALPTQTITQVQQEEEQEQRLDIRYADVAVPVMSGFIIITSLLFVKSVHELRSSIKHVNKFRESREDKH